MAPVSLADYGDTAGWLGVALGVMAGLAIGKKNGWISPHGSYNRAMRRFSGLLLMKSIMSMPKDATRRVQDDNYMWVVVFVVLAFTTTAIYIVEVMREWTETGRAAAPGAPPRDQNSGGRPHQA